MNRASNRIRGLRRERTLSASELAGQVGVSRLTLQAVEAGFYIPSLPLAIRLARALNHRVEDIFAV
jgi:putative transcriptional regulator